MPSKIVDPERSLDSEIEDLEKNRKELPSKYQGKTLEEVAEMHMNAEQALSRQGQTVGEQKKVIDQFIQFQLSDKTTNSKPEVKPITTDALFENPDKAIKQVVDSSEVNTKVQDHDKRLNALAMQLEQERFETRHEGKVREIVSDPAFHSWVQSSPHRLRMAQQLDRFDFAAGDDLINLWKDYQEVNDIKNKRDEVQAQRQKNLKAAKTEGNGVSGEQSPKQKYSRLEISSLMTKAKAGDREARKLVDNPEWQAQVRQAYVDGRVK